LLDWVKIPVQVAEATHVMEDRNLTRIRSAIPGGAMTTEQTPPRPLNALNLTIVSLERFVFVMRTIAEADLWYDAEAYLKNRGCHSMAVSLEPILALQAMMERRRTAERESADGAAERDGAGERIDRFIASACAPPPHYPPRPPDDWPPGPWDPPRLTE
jgi:hypothetical protein